MKFFLTASDALAIPKAANCVNTAGIKTVLIPEENKKELSEINKNIRDSIKVICISEAKSVLSYSLIKPIIPLVFSESENIKSIK